MNILKSLLKKIDYRHYICAGITATFLLLAVFVFPDAFQRIIEGCRDVKNSAVFYFSELFDLELHGNVTVNDFSAVPFEMPFNMPATWQEFKQSTKDYWQMLISKDNFFAYVKLLSDIAYWASKVLLVLMPAVVVLIFVRLAAGGKTNQLHGIDTKAVIVWKRFEKCAYVPVKHWVQGFIGFIRENRFYGTLWLCVWAYSFNVVTIFLEFIAFYLFFVVSFKFYFIYLQLIKLSMDLSVAFAFIPVVGWCAIGGAVLNIIRRKIGYSRLNHMERKNRGFIDERPIVLMVCGTMGKRKTTIITDMALSQEVMLRDKAFEKILEADLKFPFFPWINLEMDIKRAMQRHSVYNLATCKRFVAGKRAKWSRQLQRKKNRPLKYNGLFGYDYMRYGMEYNDNLSVTNMWKVIEDYTQLYFIYVIQSSILISNYSIRTDSVLNDAGNFPKWDSDFFKRDSRLVAAHSRHAHILDFDMLRLGKLIIENNKKANSFEFGVINITEIGKERGNKISLEGLKKIADEVNQKNDLFNECLKMVRHSATIDNFPFVKVIVDEQRPESWGADARELCDIVNIDECSEMKLAMPLFALGDLIIGSVLDRFHRRYYDHRFRRGDNTLPMYIYHGIAAMLNSYRKKIYNTFSYYDVKVLIENGRQQGEPKESTYYLMSKKIYSKRFSTDAFSDIFAAKALKCSVGINDLKTFSSEKANFDELLLENSYFFNDLVKIREGQENAGKRKGNQ